LIKHPSKAFLHTYTPFFMHRFLMGIGSIGNQ